MEVRVALATPVLFPENPQRNSTFLGPSAGGRPFPAGAVPQLTGEAGPKKPPRFLDGARSPTRATKGASPKKNGAAVKPAAKKAAKKGKLSGGLDLKALSVSWRKAGKPGRWIDWVKGRGKK